MSLAIYAAPFDNDNNDNNAINKKKSSHNRTQKKYPKNDINTEKVNSVLESIHNNSLVNEENDGLDDYYGNPPPKPMSIGSQRASTKEGMQNNVNLGTLGAQPNNYDKKEDYELNNYQTNYGDEKMVEEYYKKFIPNFSSSMLENNMKNNNNKLNLDEIKKRYYNIQSADSVENNSSRPNMDMMSGFGGNNDILIQKLNYMINLLEEKQDERTNNVTEEVVLYSFLGIFIIFVVDSFARAGKYTR